MDSNKLFETSEN